MNKYTHTQTRRHADTRRHTQTHTQTHTDRHTEKYTKNYGDDVDLERIESMLNDDGGIDDCFNWPSTLNGVLRYCGKTI